eukprot:6198094-Pleurochrysis_carterae.AAC.1
MVIKQKLNPELRKSDNNEQECQREPIVMCVVPVSPPWLVSHQPGTIGRMLKNAYDRTKQALVHWAMSGTRPKASYYNHSPAETLSQPC